MTKMTILYKFFLIILFFIAPLCMINLYSCKSTNTKISDQSHNHYYELNNILQDIKNDIYKLNQKKVIDKTNQPKNILKKYKKQYLSRLQSQSSNIKTFIHEVNQSLGDNQSQSEARKAAINRAKYEVLEKVGTYISNEITLENGFITKDKIISIAAAIFKVETLHSQPIVNEDKKHINIYTIVKVDVDWVQSL